MRFEAGLIARDAPKMKRRVDAQTHSCQIAHFAQCGRENPSAH
ncbi:hypothetical protein BH160DRAFT_0236 [Burkholderia sp. H160]|nr:hypothetical protein BH160DRAFT_0236 [Burkholderia sp. H160]